jgi:hypothetical protein
VDAERGRCVESGGETIRVLGFRGWQVEEAEEAEGVKVAVEVEEAEGVEVEEAEGVKVAVEVEEVEGLALAEWVE